MRFRHSLPLIAVVLACENDLTVVDVPVNVTLTPAADTMFVGQLATPFTAVALNLDGDPIDQPARWTSLNPNVATVDSASGLIAGVAIGQTGIVARIGSLADTSIITVLGNVTLSLRLDTILLAPGDTFTVPVTAIGPGGVALDVTFGGGDAAVATVATNGFVQAVAPGRTAFTATTDTVTVAGTIDVLAVNDTLGGQAYVVIRGAISRSTRLPSRWFQYANGVGGSIVNIAARNVDDDERVFAVLRDSLAAAGARTFGTYPTATTSTLVCNPPNGWLVYQDRRGPPLEVRSGGGTFRIQRVDPIPGGKRVSATVEGTLLLNDADAATIYGRFVVPLVTLANCPG